MLNGEHSMDYPIAIKGKKTDIAQLKPLASPIDSEYGNLTYLEWCKLEIKRIKNPKYYIRLLDHKETRYCCIATI